MRAEYLRRTETILAAVRNLDERRRRDQCLDKLAQGDKKPLTRFCGYLASTFILHYADRYQDQNINIITLRSTTDPEQFYYYVAIGSLQAPSHITHQKLHYLPYEDAQTESTYTLSDLARNNAELILVDVYRDRCFPQPIFESSNWKVSDDEFATRLSSVIGGQFVTSSREPNYLSLMAHYPITRIENYSNSDLIKAARGVIHDSMPGPFRISENNSHHAVGFLNTLFGRGAITLDQSNSANADAEQRERCRIQ